MSELKRCPFCGEKMVPSHKLLKHPNGYLKWFRFHPDNECFLSAHLIDLRETERVEAWNTRKPIESIVKRLEEVSFPDIDENYADDGQQMLFLHDAIEIVKKKMEVNE